MLNSVNLVGYIGQELELKATSTGVSYVNISLGVTRNFKDANGEAKTDWINVQAWRGTAEFLVNYAHKGDSVSVSGVLQTNTFEDQQGNKVKHVYVLANQVNIVRQKDYDGNQGFNNQGFNQPNTQQGFNQPNNQGFGAGNSGAVMDNIDDSQLPF